MATVSLNHTHFNVPIDLQFFAIPTHWSTRREGLRNEDQFIPAVNQHIERKLARVSDPEDIRKKFFRMELDGESTSCFLNNEIGVWSMLEEPPEISATDSTEILSGMRLLGGFGHRYLNHWASIESVAGLREEQKRWRELCRNRRKLRETLGPAPSTESSPGHKSVFALLSQFGNTLPVHLEWRGKHAHAVIQPVTGRELLIALAWIDLVTGAECKVCQRCGIEYSWGGRKFCNWQCEHANTMRTYRMNLKKRAILEKKGRKGR